MDPRPEFRNVYKIFTRWWDRCHRESWGFHATLEYGGQQVPGIPDCDPDFHCLQLHTEQLLDVSMAKYGGLHSSTRSEIQPRFAGIVGNQLYRIHSAIGRVSARSSRAHSVPGNHPRNHNKLSREFVLDLQKFPSAGTIGPIGCACAIIKKIFPL